MDINGFWQAGHRAPQRFTLGAFQGVKVGEKVFYNFMLMLILCLLILKKYHTLLKHAQKIRFF